MVSSLAINGEMPISDEDANWFITAVFFSHHSECRDKKIECKIDIDSYPFLCFRDRISKVRFYSRISQCPGWEDEKIEIYRGIFERYFLIPQINKQKLKQNSIELDKCEIFLLESEDIYFNLA